MTEGEARKLLLKALERHKDSPEDVVWVEDLFFETEDAFVFWAGSGPAVFPPDEDKADYIGPYAVNKKTGKCGIVITPPGAKMSREVFGWNLVLILA